MDLPISLLNHKLAAVLEQAFGHVAGAQPCPSPIVTILADGYEGV
jgi:hypothetical protein